MYMCMCVCVCVCRATMTTRCGSIRGVRGDRGVCMMGETLLEFPLGWFLRYKLSFSLSLVEYSPSIWLQFPRLLHALHSCTHRSTILFLAYSYGIEHLSAEFTPLHMLDSSVAVSIHPRCINPLASQPGRPQRDIQHTHYHPQIVVRSLCAMGCRGLIHIQRMHHPTSNMYLDWSSIDPTSTFSFLSH